MEGPTNRKSTAPRYSTEQWEKHRALITRLYSKENKRLIDVCDTLINEHGFHATTRSLKHRIRVWHLDKKQKDHEMRAIVKTYLRRKSEGKQSVFRIRGRSIDHGEIVRYFRRKGIYNLDSLSSELANAPSTPPEITCHTPDPEDHDSAESVTNTQGSESALSPMDSVTTYDEDAAAEKFIQIHRKAFSEELAMQEEKVKSESPPDSSMVRSVQVTPSTPTNLQEMEYVLSFTKDFLRSSLSWTRTPGLRSVTIDPVHWRNDFLQASYLFRTLGTDLAFAEFSSVYDRIPSLLESQDPAFFAVLVGLLCFPQNPLDFALSHQMFRYIWSMAQVVLGRTHPITLLLSCALTSDQREPLATLALRAGSDVAEANLGPHHPETVQFWEQLANGHADLEQYSEAIHYREKILEAHRAMDGDFSPYTCWALLDLACVYVHADRDEEAWAFIEQGLRLAETFAPIPRTEIQIRGIGRMAFINEKQGRSAISRMLLRQAVDVGTELLGSQQIDSFLSKKESQIKNEKWRPFSQEIRKSAMKGGSDNKLVGHASHRVDRPDLNGLASSLWNMNKGRTMIMQKERNTTVNGNSRISRNLLNLFMIQSMSDAKDKVSPPRCFEMNEAQYNPTGSLR